MADLTSADIPQSAQYVRTLGYYAANDGGGADYRIVAQSFSDIRSLELKDGRFANILTDVGNLFIDSGKLKVIAPNGSAVEIGTI